MDEPELDGYWKDVRVSPKVRVATAVERIADHASRLKQAVACYRRRKAHKSPDGQRDGHGRWYPSEKEHQKCCQGVRRPSCDYPWSLYHHCKTGRHIANMFGVTEKELREALKGPSKHRPGVKRKGPTVWDKLSKEDDDEVGHGQGHRAA